MSGARRQISGRANVAAGECFICGQTVPAGAGKAMRRGGVWLYRHMPLVQYGSPAEPPKWAGGCPEPANETSS